VICGYYTVIFRRYVATAAVETGSGEEPEATEAPLLIQDEITDEVSDDDDKQLSTGSHCTCMCDSRIQYEDTPSQLLLRLQHGTQTCWLSIGVQRIRRPLLMRRSLSVERKRYWNRSVAYPIYVFVRKVYCGKTADCIRMPFGVVSRVGRGMGVLDGVMIVKGKGSFGG